MHKGSYNCKIKKRLECIFEGRVVPLLRFVLRTFIAFSNKKYSVNCYFCRFEYNAILNLPYVCSLRRKFI